MNRLISRFLRTLFFAQSNTTTFCFANSQEDCRFMRRHFKGYLFMFLALATVVVAVLGAGFVSANEHSQKAPHVSASGSGKKATATMVAMHVVDMQKVASETSTSASH